MSETENAVKLTVTVRPHHIGIVKRLAAAAYDGNDSMAARRIIEYADTNLLPLLGIERETKPTGDVRGNGDGGGVPIPQEGS